MQVAETRSRVVAKEVARFQPESELSLDHGLPPFGAGIEQVGDADDEVKTSRELKRPLGVDGDESFLRAEDVTLTEFVDGHEWRGAGEHCGHVRADSVEHGEGPPQPHVTRVPRPAIEREIVREGFRIQQDVLAQRFPPSDAA